MNKNWNDRADKDLFFTILSVKNIGVISGPEWITIGNHMRSMGYGFTNEGCRQHFQGLRRAQNKSDASGAPSDNPRRSDPTMNPITKRPGPGRGRPRKQPAATATGAPPPGVTPSGVAPVGASPTGTPLGAPGVHPLFPGGPSAAGMQPGPPLGGVSSGPPALSGLPGGPGTPGTPGIQNESIFHGLPIVQSQPQPPPPPPPPQAHRGRAPQAQMSPEDLAVDPSLEEDLDVKPAKRPRLSDDSQDASIEDEAVLNALSVHNNPTTPGEYAAEYTYGDA
ncbi:hypothetical protein BT67DRAFT_443381 [Trichocladium antarcticum]|uniref:Myb-like domain-containing protein n=1 Tax=Trichocladium antarcticum TaxID=1450529 RepID=A0AAN6UHR8_9PEZI|nr:hypothetical protein BT67DRAFT_443381 [Trichocladium antarcticum]